MKVLILGGGGEMGRIAAREAASYDFVETVTVADMNHKAALAVANSLGSKVAAFQCDATAPSELHPLLAVHDVVLNTIGPFYRFGVPILHAVITAGKHYADICDDWEPTLEMLQLDSLAKANNVVAIIGIGASPGLTNLLAMVAASSLDQTDELLTGWSIVDGNDQSSTPSPLVKPRKPSAASVHWLQQLTGTIRQQERGQLRQVKPLQRHIIAYPGYGELPVWTVGHPEAVTLPRAFPSLTTCANVMIGPDQDFRDLKMIASLIDKGIMSIECAALELDKVQGTTQSKAQRNVDPSPPELFAWARGRRDGQTMVSSAHLKVAIPDGMAGATSIPLAMTLPLFAGGFGDRRGVFTPEDIIDPLAYFDGLATRCLGPLADAESLIVQAFLP